MSTHIQYVVATELPENEAAPLGTRLASWLESQGIIDAWRDRKGRKESQPARAGMPRP